MKSKLELYEDKSGEWRWRLKSSNGRIVASSGEGFTRKSSCRESVSNMLGTFARNEYTIIIEDK
jgi:uncharacterized protein YegP (UPF0339 family)